MTFPTLETAKLRIVAFNEQHLSQTYVEWLNDPEVVRYSEQRHHHHTLEICRAYFATFENTPHLFLAIEGNKGDLGHIGNMTVTIDPFNGLADLAILIGERQAWGKGLGLEAWSAVLSVLLAKPWVRKITAGAVESNRAMVSIMRKSGMIEDGMRRSHLLVNGVPDDVLYYAAWPPETDTVTGKQK